MTKTVRARYTLAFKQKAVRLVRAGQSIAAAARTLGVKKRGYTDGLYDAEKVVFFGERLVAQEKAAQPAYETQQLR